MKTQARLRLRQPFKPEAVMPIVNGRRFRCSCGANVFTKRSDRQFGVIFRCNGCGEDYR